MFLVIDEQMIFEMFCMKIRLKCDEHQGFLLFIRFGGISILNTLLNVKCIPFLYFYGRIKKTISFVKVRLHSIKY